MVQDFRNKLGIRIKTIREAKNMSREELAFQVGVSGSYIGMIERAENDFKISKIYKISEALGISLKDLFDSIEI